MNLQQRIEKIQLMAAVKKQTKEETTLDSYDLLRLESMKQEENERRHERFNHFLQTVPPIFRNMNLDDFQVVNKQQGKIKKIIHRFIETADERLEEKTHLIFHGVPDTGKSMLSLIMCQALAKLGHEVRYEPSLQFLRLLRDKNFESYSAFENTLNYYARVPFLVIDEVTEGRVTGSGLCNWEKEMLFALVDARYQQQKRCTLTISNRTKEDMAGTLGERIFRRLSQAGIILAFDWKAYSKP